MPGSVSPYKLQFFDNNGDPLAGGKLYVYQAGTSTPTDSYDSPAMSAANANPVVLDAAGRASIYLPQDTAYKLVLKDAADVQLWSEDNIRPALVAFDGTWVGTIATTVVSGHGIGVAATNGLALTLGGVYAPSSNPGYVTGFEVKHDMTVPANVPAYGSVLRPTFTKAGSGTHSVFAGVVIPAYTINAGGGATLTNSCGMLIAGAPSGGSPTAAYSLWIAGGDLRYDNQVALGGGAAPTLGTIGATGPATAAQNSWLRIVTASGVRFIPLWA